MRMNRPSDDSFARVIPWIQASISDAPALPPVGVIADVGALLEGGKLDLADAMQVSDPRLRHAVRAYEDGLLGRLAGDPRFEAASDALARLPDDCRAEGVAVLVEQLLSHILYPEATALSPAVARRVLSRPPPELLQLGLQGLRAGAEVLQEALAPGYEQLVHRARHTDVLLTDKDVFTLENLTVLRSLTQRVAVHQIVDAAEVLERALPRRLRPRTGRRGGTPTKIEDESAYPTGGFASITNSGSLENIVCSELVYMEDAEDAEFDLFDVRFAEGELLYYTRDESVFLRNQRWITFLLHPDLVRARFKDAELPWQRLVLIFGLVLCVMRRLHDWLNEEALLFRFVFLEREGGTPNRLAEEQELCQLLLREWIDKGTVEVTTGSLEGALTGGEATVVLLASQGEARSMLDDLPLPKPKPGQRGKGPHTVFVEVGGPRPALLAAGRAVDRERRGSALEGWIETARSLLEELL
jgi:hypothetical protein